MGGFAQFPHSHRHHLSIVNDERRAENFSEAQLELRRSVAQWVPWVVKEATRRSGSKGFPNCRLKDFNIYVTTETNDDFDFVLRYAGEDNIVIGTDYGHTDASSEVDAIDIFRANKEVADPVKKKNLG
jgi:hypothetical protein